MKPTFLANRTAPLTEALASDDARWRAVVERDPAADGVFVYAVRTTGVYCRNVCPARRALRQNVRFYATCREAEQAGFRPCKRCRPHEARLAAQQAAMIAHACRLIEKADEEFRLNELAKRVGLSPFHFHRIFKAQTGITPKAYAQACRARRVRRELVQRATVTEALYGAGYNSSGRFYATAKEVLGMPPKSWRAGGAGERLRCAAGQCWLGALLVAASEQGICAILLGDDPEMLTRDLQARFPRAELIRGDAEFAQRVSQVVAFLENPADGLDLPLDIRGTAFQQKVWAALRQIPAGSTTTYSELATQLGQPRAARAVASACAANPLAVAVPCHRVVRRDGNLSGYRWGIERKRELLAREQPPS